ncbi:MAG: hypothetical protein ACHQ2Y_01615 [Candidatus Lutacidiplasmatales archaeon]
MVTTICLALVLVSLPGGLNSLGGKPSSVSRAQPAGSPACNPVPALAVSALYVNLPEPTQNLSPGGVISSYLEFQVQNYTSADNNITLYFPSVYFTFPLASGVNFSYYLTPRALNITSAGWSNSALLSRNATVASGLNFVPGGIARLTSQKVAIMATAGYGAITVEFRWHFSIHQPGAPKSIKSPNSVPVNHSAKGGQLPSIFFPAPYVSYLGGTGSIGVIGTNYTGALGGFVAGRLFFLEMEGAGGHVAQDFGQTAPSNVSTFNVTIPIINYNGQLSPGMMLVHIHDSCGALLYNKVFRAVYPPNATLQFIVNPGSCSGITFNGTKYANSTSGVFLPSPTPYNFSIGCKKHHFSSWLTTGGLHIASGSQMVVSASGTFTVNYT